MTTFYLSGPMRGKPSYNHETFCAVESALIAERYATADQDITDRVINPSRNFDGDTSLDIADYMTVDLRQVLDADVVVLLPGWHDSEGARREVSLGIWTGKKFLDARPSGDAWAFVPADVAAPMERLALRAEVLDKARGLITGDRNNAYGPPHQDFKRTADALNAMGYRGPDGRPLLSHDTAIMVMMVKLSRLMWTPGREDSWIDLAGYAGCGYECAIADEREAT